MSRIEIAAECADDLLPVVEHDVQDELQPGAVCALTHVAVDAVALDHAGAGVRVVDVAGAVVEHRGGAADDAGQHGLAAAGEAGEEVRLDEALGHEKVRLIGDAVEQQAVAGGHEPQIDKAGVVVCVVDDDPLMGDDFLAVAVEQLLRGGGTVAARGHEDGDAGLRRAGTDLAQDQRHQQAAGHRAGVVAGDDDDVLLPPDAVAQPGSSVRMGERLLDERALGHGRLKA